MKRKPKTYTTVECMVRDIRRGSFQHGVTFLSALLRAVRVKEARAAKKDGAK